jgi:hypothetical protein
MLLSSSAAVAGEGEPETVVDNTKNKEESKKLDKYFGKQEEQEEPAKIEVSDKTYATTEPDAVNARRRRFEPGFGLGFKVSWAFPMGKKETNSLFPDLSASVTGLLAIGADIGYRLNPNVFLGMYLGAGYVFPKDCGSGVTCTGWDFRGGPEFLYRFQPFADIVPWAGLGVGYEYFVQKASGGVSSYSAAYHGFQLADVQAGVDFLTSRSYAGPFVSFSLGQFGKRIDSSTDSSHSSSVDGKELHYWLALGLHGSLE